MARALYGGGMHDARRGRRVGMAISAAPPVMAEVLEAEPEDATAALRKRSRVHEVYSADPNDDNYSLCQCRENVQGGRVCGGRIKSRGSTKSLWNHVQKKHPCTFAKLNNQGDIAHAPLSQRLWQFQQSFRSVSRTSRW